MRQLREHGFWGFETLKTLGFFKLTRFARSFRNRFLFVALSGFFG
ncbi:hypothetical protein HMPREF1414_00201 [Helicobacter pylori GAM252T]|nr:hypothetical protein HMPREF1412_01506 [Helicobacter pylori GAM250T]EMH14309.1 hypothetical protein HMPREF1413_00990 [Helicobacter pylori GAM252Bi]EMH16521.1 hypothetical protein HMPREF1414_00201 [Helicobacter pylori GAM252T]EMH51430.1 hypothetical protein HMPREF1442_01395 [Helicobacter pylori HP250ASii]EMH53451.1 hypothetical protein HMPREF1441_00775 [Helicobacter pylori HP250ASi]EMH54105.1 hypothetical protein HMPREF1440_00097 [Helicobacter pylori HP250AFiV]EMH57272.1 hypothetical protein